MPIMIHEGELRYTIIRHSPEMVHTHIVESVSYSESDSSSEEEAKMVPKTKRISIALKGITMYLS